VSQSVIFLGLYEGHAPALWFASAPPALHLSGSWQLYSAAPPPVRLQWGKSSWAAWFSLQGSASQYPWELASSGLSGHGNPIMGCGWSLLCPATHCRGPSPDLRLTAGTHHRTCTVPLLSTVSADQTLHYNILIL